MPGVSGMVEPSALIELSSSATVTGKTKLSHWPGTFAGVDAALAVDVASASIRFASCSAIAPDAILTTFPCKRQSE